MTDDEIAAFHEAAHAVFAVIGRWTKLAGPVILHGEGCGDLVISTDVEAVRRSIRFEQGFDRDLPRIQLIRAMLAGPIAEHMLCERGLAGLSEVDLEDAAEVDRANIAAQLDKLAGPRPDLLGRLEREVRETLGRPAVWTVTERFAATLLERGRLEAEEASAILEELRAEQGLDLSWRDARSQPPLFPLFVLVAAVLMAAFWLS